MTLTDYGAFCPACGAEGPSAIVEPGGVTLGCCGAFDPNGSRGVVPNGAGSSEPEITDIGRLNDVIGEAELVLENRDPDSEEAGMIAAALPVLKRARKGVAADV